MIPGIKNNYGREIDGQLTFYGVLIDHYSEISKDWNDETKEEYGKHYDKLILPHFVENPLKYYNDVSYFDEIISFIKKSGTIRNSEATYSEERLQHFRFLMRTVVDTAASHGICDNVLWGTQYKNNEITADLPAEKDKKLRLDTRLYLTTSEMLRILSDIYVDIKQAGIKFALLLMCIFGLRNKEACGIWFEDIMEIPGHPGHYVLVVHSSTEGRTRFRKTGGKTDNMFRMIPIPPAVYEFLMERKKYILSLLDIANKDLPKRKQYIIDRMPIACNGDKFWEACTSVQVTAAGRDLFRRIEFSENAFLLAEEESGFDASGYRNQKSPTAYIFRKEFCTSLYALGFTPEEIQYLMGHKINNPEFSRQHFRNSDILINLYNKLVRRPLREASNTTDVICASEQRLLINDTTDVTIKIPCDGHKYRVRIYNKHLSDSPSISIIVPDDTNFVATIDQQAIKSKPEKTVSVLENWRQEVNRRVANTNNQAADPE